jgi:hypothetical protein
LEQLENGSPVVPGGHVHVALWFVTEHIADGLQGLFVAQGFMQLLDTQAWNEEHSSSEEQPASTGSTAWKHIRYSIVLIERFKGSTKSHIVTKTY